LSLGLPASRDFVVFRVSVAFKLCSCAVIKVDLMNHCEKEGMKVYSKLASLPGNHERLTTELEDFLKPGGPVFKYVL